MIPWLESASPFPPVDRALDEPNGLLAAGGELTLERLLEAYRNGIFPWYSDGQPVLWWSPDPRTVLYVDEFKVPRSLGKVARQRRFEITVDVDFVGVIRACAGPRDGVPGTWITARMMNAYIELHRQGYAHSLEAWSGDRLAGGLYGIAIGRMFFGESMFADEDDASKVALVHLVGMLRARDFPLIDCQQETAHLARFGARPIPRKAFAEHLATLVNSGAPDSAWVPLPASEVL